MRRSTKNASRPAVNSDSATDSTANPSASLTLEPLPTLFGQAETVLLAVSKPNAKIPHWSFSLPSGFTCPGAKQCLAKADRKTGKITDGPEADYRCYSASQEGWHPYLRKQRWRNFIALRILHTTDRMAQAIAEVIALKLPRTARLFRLHVGGDFYNETYFKAWVLVAQRMPDILFYGYTKSIVYLVKNMPLPRNLRLTVSKGGRRDDLIEKHHLKFSVVVSSEEEAGDYEWRDQQGQTHVGLEIDHDDSHAWKDDKPFALLLHGIQPKGSKAAEELRKLGGLGGRSSYPRKRISLPAAEGGADN